MAYTEASKRASIKYMNKAYDRIAIRVKKGRRDEIKEIAQKAGMSMAKLINVSIDEYAENHGIKND